MLYFHFYMVSLMKKLKRIALFSGIIASIVTIVAFGISIYPKEDLPNNIAKEEAPEKPAAISTKSSSGLVIEGNTFNGVNQAISVENSDGAIIRDNKINS